MVVVEEQGMDSRKQLHCLQQGRLVDDQLILAGHPLGNFIEGKVVAFSFAEQIGYNYSSTFFL